MQCQKWLTLHWYSFLGGSSIIVCSIVVHIGRQYYDYGKIPLHIPVIIHDVRPQIVDAPLTLISMPGQCACRFPFYLLRRPILRLWMDATMQPGDCWIGITINHWCSIEAYHWAHHRDIVIVIPCSTIIQKMHTAFIGSQYTVSMYYHLNPRSSRHHSFWPTTIQVMYMINDVLPSRFKAFSWQFTA